MRSGTPLRSLESKYGKITKQGQARYLLASTGRRGIESTSLRLRLERAAVDLTLGRIMAADASTQNKSFEVIPSRKIFLNRYDRPARTAYRSNARNSFQRHQRFKRYTCYPLTLA